MRVCLPNTHICTCVTVVNVKKFYGFMRHEAFGPVLEIREDSGKGPVTEIIGTEEQSKKDIW